MTSRQKYYKTVTQVYYPDVLMEKTLPYPTIQVPLSSSSTQNEHEHDKKETYVKETFITNEKYTDPINPLKTVCDHDKIIFPPTNLKDPQVWGPSLWFVLHNAANNYPLKATPLYIERMKNVIIGLPVLVVCETCKEHATAFIEKHRLDLDFICSTRETLFKFFVDFHNKVNQRYKKPILSYEEAFKLYNPL